MKKKLDAPLIVVTGAAGLIGSGCVRHLNDQGVNHILLVDDIKKTNKWKNLLGKRGVDFISRHALFDWLEGRADEVAAFIHLGACSDTLETDGDYLMQNNYRYSVKLAEYALLHGKRFIYASSAATYGNGRLGFKDDHATLETLKPLNLYGFSKCAFDCWAKAQGVLDHMVGLKYFNVFGPNENHKGRMASMVYKMLPIIQEEGVIQLFRSFDPERFADGDQQRDFIYVKDAVRMTCAFLDNAVGGIFNIGSGQPTTWNTLANALFAALGRKPHIQYIDMPKDMISQYQNYTCAEMDKYKSVFGESLCRYGIEEAVSDYINNYLLTGERW